MATLTSRISLYASLPFFIKSLQGGYKNYIDKSKITKTEIQALIEGDQKAYALIDVRSDHEIADGMIPTAKQIRLDGIFSVSNSSQDVLIAFQMEETEFKQLHGFDKPKKDVLLVMYCRVGKRSAVSQYIARKLGYEDVRNYVGSYLDWESSE